jgi:phosphopantetheinyl transferase
MVACALAAHAIGIDVECHEGRERDIAGLAEIALGESERDRVLAVPSVDAQRLAFLAAWTLKEAWIKARGHKPSLDRIETSPARGNDGNALLWQTSRYTLAVVGVGASEQVTLCGPEAPSVAPQAWRVQLTSA